jgi:superfamily II DNA/RNA helicase
MNANTSTPNHGWTIKRIHDITGAKFGKQPCWYQIKTALAIYEGKNVIGCAPTGAGKTLSFWIPLLMAQEDGKDRMSFVITPLNLLGKQNVKDLEAAGLPADRLLLQSARKLQIRRHLKLVLLIPDIIIRKTHFGHPGY